MSINNMGFVNQNIQRLDAALKDIQKQLFHLSQLGNSDTIEHIDAAKEELKKREYELKKQKVLEMHPYKIRKRTRKKNNNNDYVYYTTTCPWLDNEPRVHNERELINKLYSYYFGDDEDSEYSFRSMFRNALEEKIKTEAPKEKTIRDYYTSYNAFITDDFGRQDIRNIKSSQVKEYIQTIVQELSLTKKRFYKFKGILNLVFDYAVDSEHRYIDVNPVPHHNRAYNKNLKPTSNKPENKAFQPSEVAMIRDYLWKRIDNSTYDVYGYAIIFSSYTGIRLGEIPSLKWSDISYSSIHIHSQQNDEKQDDKKVYYYNPTTKNEKGISRNGRFIPLTDNIRRILDSLKNNQHKLGITSEWVFCNKDGEWITTKGYYDALYRLTKKLGLQLTNNHAFRMYINSYVYVPIGLPVTERAKLLGHSVETNLNHYTFARTDDYLDELSQKINAFESGGNAQSNQSYNKPNNGHTNIIRFNPNNSESATNG